MHRTQYPVLGSQVFVTPPCCGDPKDKRWSVLPHAVDSHKVRFLLSTQGVFLLTFSGGILLYSAHKTTKNLTFLVQKAEKSPLAAPLD